jgi:hypothetical protein
MPVESPKAQKYRAAKPRLFANALRTTRSTLLSKGWIDFSLGAP